MKSQRLVLVLFALFVLVIGTMMLLVPTPAARAAPTTGAMYIVTGTSDSNSGSCLLSLGKYYCPSLRLAVIAANANPGSEVVLAHSAIYTLSIAASGTDDATTGDLNITRIRT